MNPSAAQEAGLRGRRKDPYMEECSQSESDTTGSSSPAVSPIGKDFPEVKPWSCARATFVVKPAGKTGKGRQKQLRESKETLRQNLPNSPYVGVLWENTEGIQVPMTGLVDTGADWSLLVKSELSMEEWEELKPSEVVGQGVTKSKIPVIGEVWRNLTIGGVAVPNQRFIVVEDMITPIILGADFWLRFGEFSINFGQRKLKLGVNGTEVDLLDSVNGITKEDDGQVFIVSESEIHIPPFSEMVVRGKITGGKAKDGDEILVEPVGDDKDLCSIPYMISSVQENTVLLKIANIGLDDYILEENKLLGTGVKKFGVCSSIHRGTGDGSKNTASHRNINLESMCAKKLDQTKKEELLSLLEEFQDVFYSGGKLETVRVGIEHRIRLKENTAPIAHRPRRLSLEEQAEVREEIDELIKMGIVRQSNSPWAAPIVCARKPTGKLRLAIDYRGLNNVSLPATLHPIPRIDDLFDCLGEANFFSIMDAKSGYHQLPLPEEESELTAFVVPWGHYEFVERTPFGLKGAGYSFQRFMSTLLGECNFKDALCYLDDILIWSRTWEEHKLKLRKVLEKIRQGNLKLGPSKCSFGVDEVQYLGATIKNGMLSISEQRVKSLRQLPLPKTVTELRSALGAFSYVQRWLPGLAEINKPLNDAVRGTGTRKLVWTKEMKDAFNQLKTMTANAVALQIPDMDRKFTLVTDGSDRGIGSMLAQEDHDGANLIPIAFYHHSLTKAQQKYSTTDKELLAVYLSVQKFRVYLGKPFKLITDHSAVKFMRTLNANDERGRRGRWVEYLQQFDMELVHRGGTSKELSVADYLSRVNNDGTIQGVAVVKTMEAGEVPVKGFLSVEELRKMQLEDEQIKIWWKHITQETGEGIKAKEDSPKLKFLQNMLLDSTGILRILYPGGRKGFMTQWGNAERYRVVVPKAMVEKVLEFVHKGPAGGHMGFKRTYKRCRDAFWWLNMSKDIKDYLQQCEQCGKNKHETHPNVAPLQIMDIPDKVFDKLQVDFLGPFPTTTAHEYLYALQIQDILSRYVMFVPTQNDSAQIAASALFEEWVCKFGPPRIIQSDRGTHFAAAVFELMCHQAGMKHVMGSPGHAESQGQVERQNQLMNQIRSLAENNTDRWPKAMSRIAYVHNISPNATTAISPFKVVFAAEARTVESVMLSTLGESNNKLLSPEEQLSRTKKHKDEVEREAKEATVAAQKERAE